MLSIIGEELLQIQLGGNLLVLYCNFIDMRARAWFPLLPIRERHLNWAAFLYCAWLFTPPQSYEHTGGWSGVVFKDFDEKTSWFSTRRNSNLIRSAWKPAGLRRTPPRSTHPTFKVIKTRMRTKTAAAADKKDAGEKPLPSSFSVVVVVESPKSAFFLA